MLYEKWRQKSENFQLEKGLYLASYKKILKKARITTRTFNVKNFILISNEGAWREKKSQSCPFFGSTITELIVLKTCISEQIKSHSKNFVHKKLKFYN